MAEFDAFILIGGRSSRFGSDKALADLDGKSLVQHAVDTVSKALPDQRITLVAANATQFAIQAIVDRVPFILDLYENRGPLGGLHAALAHAQTPWIFLLACDYPRVSAEIIEFLGGKVDEAYGAVVPQQADGRLQPLCAFYKVQSALPFVEATIERPRVPPPMHEIVTTLECRVVEFDEYAHLSRPGDVFFNVNTMKDLEQVRQTDTGR